MRQYLALHDAKKMAPAAADLFSKAEGEKNSIFV